MNKFKALLIYPNTMMATLIPIGISQLAGMLRENNIDVRVFDTTYYRTEEKSFEEKRVELLQIKSFDLSEAGIKYKESDIYEDLRTAVEEYSPHLIGITIVEDTLDLGLKLLEAIKDFDIPVVAGGVHATLNPEEIIKEGNIDFICIGEGEGAIVELCNNLAAKKDVTCIKNLWVKKGLKIYKNALRPLIELDENPFMDLSVWESSRFIRPMYGKNYNMLHIEIERGCPFECTYCSAPALRKIYPGNNKYFRRKSHERVIKELKHYLRSLKADYIYFNAESFLSMPTQLLKDFAGLYIKEIDLPFWCQSRVENITEEKVKILKAMGCANMQFGIESGNENFRTQMLLRGHSNGLILKALRTIERDDIPYTVNNIIGFPEETREMIFDTINLNRQLHPRTINCFMFTPYKGTALRTYCIEKGYLSADAKTQQTLDGAPLQNMQLSREELKGLQKVFPLYCRFPIERFGEIEAAESFDESGSAMFSKLNQEYREKFFKQTVYQKAIKDAGN